VAAATGLLEGTPVAGGMFDIDACAIAMGLVDEQDIAVIAGTWSINEYISKKPVVNKSIMMNSLYAMEEFYLIEESSPTSAGNHAWFIDMFMAAEKLEAEKGVSAYTGTPTSWRLRFHRRVKTLSFCPISLVPITIPGQRLVLWVWIATIPRRI